jgi:hypothetical protein
MLIWQRATSVCFSARLEGHHFSSDNEIHASTTKALRHLTTDRALKEMCKVSLRNSDDDESQFSVATEEMTVF